MLELIRLLLVGLLVLAGCAYQPQFIALCGEGSVSNRDRGFRGLRCEAVVIQRFGKYGITGCTHSSDPTTREDVSANLCGIGLTIGGGSRK